MCELETNIIPKLEDTIEFWTRYVDDTFAFIKANEVKNVQQVLNSYDTKIQFTHETEKERTIAFLDVLIERNEDNYLETSVYRKKTNNNIYMNWNSYSPRSWKIGTLRNLVKRAIMISSTDTKLQIELDHLQRVFCEINDYPPKITKSIIDDEVGKSHQTNHQSNNDKTTSLHSTIDKNKEENIVQINLPFAGSKGQNLLKKLKRTIEKESKENIKVRITYTPSKLGSKFQVKDKTKFEHQHNVTYHIDCGHKKCSSNYVGQTKCRIIKRTLEHNNRDNASHVLCHSKKTKHRRVMIENVKVLGKGYKSDFKRRISESLFIKELKPDLNKQKDAFRLKLYN